MPAASIIVAAGVHGKRAFNGALQIMPDDEWWRIVEELHLSDYCCSGCFEHPWLRAWVEEHGKRVPVRCRYCRGKDNPVLEPPKLRPFFQNVLTAYELGDSDVGTGIRLVRLLQADHSIFNEVALPEAERERLLETIAWRGPDPEWNPYDVGYPVGMPIEDGAAPVHARDHYVRTTGRWSIPLRWEWKRFAQASAVDPVVPVSLTRAFDALLVRRAVEIDRDSKFVRVRPGCDSDDDTSYTPYMGAEIGAPPRHRARAGRANKRGRRVLYCADSESTAVAECRPARGILLSVCHVCLKRNLKLLDLTPPTPLNPFTTPDLATELELQGFAATLAGDLATPLERDDDQAVYVPTQVFAEYVRSQHCDGIRYPSAMRPEGFNVVLFNHRSYAIDRSWLVRVNSVSFSCSPA